MSDQNGNPKSDNVLIGSSMRKIEGLAKSTGRAVYTDDVTLPGLLHGKILRSPHAHARIVSIDTSRAEALEGVHAVITGRDMPVQYGIIPWTPDEYPLCVDRVRYIGDGVAAVAAVDEDTAIEALALIDVEYEQLPAFLDPHDAADADGSTPYIHDARKDGWNGNITKMVKLEFGDIEGGLDDADVVIEGDYFFEGTTHAPIEPHCAIGQWDGVNRLTVWSATQVPHYLHRELARVLELDQAQVRVLQPLVGGAFGGKSEPFDLEFCVGKLAMMTGRPVKILYTREEVFYSHRGRHPFHMKYRTGATKRREADLGRCEDPARRRGVRFVRPRHHVLLGAAPLRAVRHAGVPLRLDPGVHEQACLWPEARPRLGPAPLRLRGPDRQARRAGRARSDRVPSPELHRRAHAHRQRAAGHVERLPGVPLLGRGRERMERTSSAGCRSGAESASPGPRTSRAPTIRSTRTRCRSRPSRCRSTAVGGSRSSAAPARSGRDATPSSRTSPPKSSAYRSTGSGSSGATPTSRRSTWVRTRAA